MKDERYKQIMTDLGMPNSRSLLGALQQVANEVAQEWRAACTSKQKEIDDLQAQLREQHQNQLDLMERIPVNPDEVYSVHTEVIK